MIKIERLRDLLAHVPAGAKLYAYEGEGTGFVVMVDGKHWGFIEANYVGEDDTWSGFEGTPHARPR